MREVEINLWGRTVFQSLEDALTPEDEREGRLESVQASATAACEAMGRLLAHMVNSGALELQKARRIAGHYADCEFVKEKGPA